MPLDEKQEGTAMDATAPIYGTYSSTRRSTARDATPDTHRPVAYVARNSADAAQLQGEIENIFGAGTAMGFSDGAALLRYLENPRMRAPRLIFVCLGGEAGGMDALTTIEMLQGRLALAGVPVVAVGGPAEMALRQDALASGASGFMQKPVSRWEITKIMQGKTLSELEMYR